jgi:hypothetical protein
MNSYQKKFFKLIEDERERQDKLWGLQDHEDFVWSSILMGEIGDLSKVLLRYNDDDSSDIEKEIIHCSAVLCNMFENIQREVGEE